MKMNSRSIAFLITVFVLSAILVGSALAYLLHTKAAVGDILVFITIVILAVGAVLAALIAWRIQQRKLRNLGPEFREVYEQINRAIAASSLRFADKREVGRDLLDLFSQAEQAGKTIDQVVGAKHSIETITNEIVDAHGMKNHVIAHWISGLQCLAVYLVLGQALTGIKDRGSLSSFFETKVDCITLLFFTLVALVVLPFVFYFQRKMSGRKNWMAMLLIIFIALPLFIGLVYIGSMDLIRAYALGVDWINRFYYGSVTIIPNVLILALMVVVIIGGFPLKRAINRTGIRLG